MTATGKQEVDPALWALVEGFPPIDVSAETLAEFRDAFRQMSPLPDPSSHPDVRVEEILIEARDAGEAPLRCLLYRRRQRENAGVLLHIHGGGYVMGLPEMDASRNIALSRDTGCAILSVDYRLAPEHPFPAALDDCHRALRWLATRAGLPGIDVRRIGVIGESAGGGLAAALAGRARDDGTTSLACQILIYPMLAPPALSHDHEGPDTRTGQFIWTRASNAWCWSAYLPPGTPAPVRGDAGFRGLPPALLVVGELDLFVHDNLAHASELLQAGCSVELHLYPGAIHGFDRAVEAPVSRRFTSELNAFIARHLT